MPTRIYTYELSPRMRLIAVSQDVVALEVRDANRPKQWNVSQLLNMRQAQLLYGQMFDDVKNVVVDAVSTPIGKVSA